MGARRHPLAPLRLRFGRWAYRFRLFAEQQSRLGEVINRSVEQHGWRQAKAWCVQADVDRRQRLRRRQQRVGDEDDDCNGLGQGQGGLRGEGGQMASFDEVMDNRDVDTDGDGGPDLLIWVDGGGDDTGQGCERRAGVAEYRPLHRFAAGFASTDGQQVPTYSTYMYAAMRRYSSVDDTALRQATGDGRQR
ncbi:hypothetical protein CIB48_g544 [Xylaria polymorpha]|nr:hypothetical protein CIB48_g544 [Xylaria polymorpha]